MRKLITLLAALTLVAPLMFYGCSGDDGAAGAPGDTGATGATGAPGPGALAKETCVVCHGAGKDFAVDKEHGLDPASRDTLKAGTAEVVITDVVLPAPTDNYVKARVDFTFQAFDSAGNNITDKIDLRTTNTAGTSLSYATFSIAKLEPGVSNQWSSFVLDPGAGGSGPYRTIVPDNTNGADFSRTPGIGIDTYSYTFADNVLRVDDGYVDNVVYRVTVQASNFNVALFTSDPALQPNDRRAVANAFRDQVGHISGAAVTTDLTGYPTRNIVTTAACNQCHDPLGQHSQGARRETTYCVVCHNPRTELEGNPDGGGFDNVSMVNMVHKLHINPDLAEDLGWEKTPGEDAIVFGIDISGIGFPQDMRNCTTCHQGGTDSDNWKTKPTRYACGSCHLDDMFATGTHVGRADSGCTFCHAATGGTKADSPPSVTVAHSTDTATPGNVTPGLDNIAYFIDNVTVDNNSFPVVTFRVEKNGTPIVFNTYAGTDNALVKRAFVDNGLIDGYTGSPSFLVAFAADQDGIHPVADYNNLGNGKTQGQPATVSVAEIFLNDNNAGTIVSGPDGSGNYTVKLLKQVTRASAANGGAITGTFSAQYPAGSYMRAVGLQGRVRQVVGGVEVARPATSVVLKVTGETRERRVVVDKNSCLECHEQLALHGSNRVNEVQLCVMCHNPNLGEGGAKSVNLKDLVHAIHSGTTAYPPWSETRGTTGMGWANITYPGDLTHCTKCHIGTTYKADLPAGVLLSTNSEMGVAPAPTDNVVSPTAAACGRCHNESTSIDHFRLQGGDVGVPREEAAIVGPYVLSPLVTP